MSNDLAIRAEGLVKHYGETTALKGLDLEAESGRILGVLGPNGAGKTTAVRILTTLLQPDGGHASVGGYDVVKQADEVRTIIGLTGQYAAVDEYLTGFENLEMVGRLSRLGKKNSRARAVELLERFELTDAGGRMAKTYSGGMRRRLDLAASLVAQPKVLFLDEPTTGLDPYSRLAMWDVISELVAAGTTLLLTTQYLDEADRLADQIVVIDKGYAIAKGTSDELKTQVGGERIELTVKEPVMLEAAVKVLEAHGKGGARTDAARRSAGVAVTGGAQLLAEIIRGLDGSGVVLDDFGLRRPTLDDVFLSLTGHAAEEGAADESTVQTVKSGMVT